MNKYHGPIWGTLPEDFPREILEQSYRKCIDRFGQNDHALQLMGMGFAGTAYRFRTMAENAEILSTSLQKDGCGPYAEAYYQQVTSLYIFFSAGLSCIESFFFAMHALGSKYKPNSFALSPKDLGNVRLLNVKKAFNTNWEGSDIAIAMEELLASAKLFEWKEIRNIFSHRAVIPRQITFNCSNGQTTANLLLEKHSSQKRSVSLSELEIANRRMWLANQINHLVGTFDLFIKQ
jgi:hypothetical protein